MCQQTLSCSSLFHNFSDFDDNWGLTNKRMNSPNIQKFKGWIGLDLLSDTGVATALRIVRRRISGKQGIPMSSYHVHINPSSCFQIVTFCLFFKLIWPDHKKSNWYLKADYSSPLQIVTLTSWSGQIIKIVTYILIMISLLFIRLWPFVSLTSWSCRIIKILTDN